MISCWEKSTDIKESEVKAYIAFELDYDHEDVVIGVFATPEQAQSEIHADRVELWVGSECKKTWEKHNGVWSICYSAPNP